MTKTADVVIIGGGVNGTSIAYVLAKRGKKVILCEREDHASGATGSCDQMIMMQSKKPGFHLSLAMTSSILYENLSKELDTDIQFERKGGLITIENELEMEVMEKEVREFNQTGLKAEIISIQEALKIQPGLNPNLLGCSYCASDGMVDPFKLNLGFAKAAKKAGAEILLNSPVTEIIMEGGKAKGVRTPTEDIFAEVVVVAAGAWSGEVCQGIELNVPIKPRKGQIMITEPTAPFVKHGILSAKYIVAKHHPETLKDKDDLASKLGIGLSLTQGQRGEILIGATREFVGFEKSNTRTAIREVLKNATRLVPGLKDLNIIHIMSGFRPYTPDGLPLIGFVNKIPGLFMACGHEGDGIALAPVTGQMAAALINGEKSNFDTSLLDPNRFEL